MRESLSSVPSRFVTGTTVALSSTDQLKAQIEQRRLQRAASGVMGDSADLSKSDPIEEAFRGQIEEEKKSYKTTFNRLKALKTEIEHLQLLLEKAKVKLKKDFEGWWSEETAKLQPPAQQGPLPEAVPKRAWKTPEQPASEAQQTNQSNRYSNQEKICTTTGKSRGLLLAQ
nr:PREDICTED: kinesin-like protein KIF6 [Latimeria chalumnae]|eukprot:XP_006013020.2 PREDICTED: kinesin-like protein KIF6 [Latimeria chalumnae]